MSSVDIIDPNQYTLGEGPHWDIETQSLYFVDIFNPDIPIYRYAYAENKTYSARLIGAPTDDDDRPIAVSFIIPIDGRPNEYVISLNLNIVVIQWDGISNEAHVLRVITSIAAESSQPLNQINDGKVDPAGRLYFGTMNVTNLLKAATESTYKYAPSEGVVKLLDNIFLANGLTWNAERRKFYYVDTGKFNIMEYDYDQQSGNIANGRVLIDLTEYGAGPLPKFVADGMTIDTNGFLYVAIFNGSKILKINPTTGKIDAEIALPIAQVTSVAFGGPNLNELFVTSSSHKFTDKNPTPPAGVLFKIRGDAAVGTGLPMNKMKL